MKGGQGAFGAACAALLAAMALSACGGDEGGGEKPAKTRVGEASRSTNDRADAVRPGGSRLPDGALEGEPSLDDLDRSAPPPGALGAPGTSCGGGDLDPSDANLSQIRTTTVCLLNVERKVRGLHRLRTNRRLARAALVHTKDMVRRTYFAHDSPSGASSLDRIRRGGYLSGAVRWTVGENIAWGSGSRSTPRKIVDSWMNSPGHRANILSRQFREIGIGVVVGAPVNGVNSRAATYNTNFGARRRG